MIHALKEGFDRANMIEAALNGSVIEDYVDAKSARMWDDDDSGDVNLFAHRL